MSGSFCPVLRLVLVMIAKAIKLRAFLDLIKMLTLKNDTYLISSVLSLAKEVLLYFYSVPKLAEPVPLNKLFLSFELDSIM